MRRVAVFMDAGYFWVQVSSLIVGSRSPRGAISLDYTKLRESVLKEVITQFPDIALLRVYWYDGPGPSGKTSEHYAIDNLDDFKLRLGTRNGIGQQKAVDGLVIADMISLTQSKAITDALLISGDADMTPGVAAAQAMGLRVHLLEIGSRQATSPHLSAEVDRKRSWTHVEVSAFAAAASVSAAVTNATVAVSGRSVAPVAGMPSATPASGSAAPDAQIDFPLIAKTAHTGIQSGPLANLLVDLPSTTLQLPPDIDRELLRTARRLTQRVLSESEKRGVRAEFKKLL